MTSSGRTFLASPSHFYRHQGCHHTNKLIIGCIPVCQIYNLAPRGVKRSPKLNHVESACAKSPNTSPLTPHCPAHTQTKSLTHQPRPVPTFRRLWSGKSVPITDWTLGASLIETNIMLLAHVWEWFNIGEQEAAGIWKSSCISHYTYW